MKPIAPIHYKDKLNYRAVHDQIHKILRRHISMGDGTNADNIDGAWGVGGSGTLITIPAVANTEFAVTHNLNRIPIGYHIVYKSAALDIYASTTAWSKTKIFLKSPQVAGNIRLFIF